MPTFFSTLSRDLGDAFDFQEDSNEFGECMNELAESFLQFIQGNYIQASEVK
jgi:hypothetical protein